MDYRAWLQSDPSKAWALNYVGNDYNSANSGIDINKLQTSSLQDDYSSSLSMLQGYASQYGKTLGGNTLSLVDDRTAGTNVGTNVSPTYNPQEAALYDQAIGNAESGMGRLGVQEQFGRDKINSSYESALNTLRGSKSIADRDYTNTSLQNTKDNVNAKSTIDFNTGRQANALQRLLGSRGSGRSTAATIAAPYAAALQGTQQRRGVSENYAQNAQALDTNYGDFNSSYNTQVEGTGRQKDEAINELQSNTLGRRNSLLTTLADLRSRKAQLIGGNAVGAAQPYLDQVNANNNQIDQLSGQYANRVTAQAPTFKAPEFARYDVQNPQAAQIQGGSAYGGSINPAYLSVLLGGKKKQQATF